MRNYTRIEIISFLESFESLVKLSSKDGISLSLDDIYYIEYCRVKAEGLLSQLTSTEDGNKSVKNELSMYKSSIELVVEQIKVVEKIMDVKSLNIESKIDRQVTDYEFSVRKPGNYIYTEPYLTKERDLVEIFSSGSYFMIGTYIALGLHIVNWDRLNGTALRFAVLAGVGVIYLAGSALTALLLGKASGKVKFKRNYVKKQVFIEVLLSKILISTNRNEYLYLIDAIKKIRVQVDNLFKVYYVMAKIEILGEYINMHQGDAKGTDFENNKAIEGQLRAIHILLQGAK